MVAVLRQVGVVDKEDIAEKLRGSLMHGQILTTKNGGLWRWDGFVVQGEVSNQSSVRLTQMARLREVLDELTNLNKAKEEVDLICENNDRKLKELDFESQVMRNEYKDAFEALDKARKNFGDAQQLELEFNNQKDRLTEMKNQLIADLNETQKLKAVASDELNTRETNDTLNAESTKLRQELFNSREKLVEARGRLQNIVTQAADRQKRLSAIHEELKAWMDRIQHAEIRMKDLNIRKDIEISELERLENRPSEVKSHRTKLEETKIVAEVARKNAADELAVAETELSVADKLSREADQKLSIEREERVRCEAIVEQVNLSQSALTDRIRENCSAYPMKFWRRQAWILILKQPV